MILLIAILMFSGSASAADHAPGGPGNSSTFQSGRKEGFGTARDARSRVWFTITDGAVSEVYSRLISNPMLRGIEFAVTDGATFTDFESTDMEHEVRLVDSHALCYEITSFHREHGYAIRKRVFTDPSRDALIIAYTFIHEGRKLDLYVLADPMGNGTGDNDAGSVVGGAFILNDSDCAVVRSSRGFEKTSVGYRGVNDGYAQLRDFRTLRDDYSSAGSGNIVFTGKIAAVGGVENYLIVGFGKDSMTAISASEGGNTSAETDRWKQIENEFIRGWKNYCAALTRPPAPSDTLFHASAMILAACEDKENPGAFIASPSMGWGDIGGPWGDFRGDTNDQYYFKIWSRDLYHTASALIALSDVAAARRALDFLDRRAQLPDGSFPQTTDIFGRKFWPTIQMDQVACPILLLHSLIRIGAVSAGEYWSSLARPAAEYIVKNGPFTRAERWEERDGFSPATISSQVAALYCAADIARLLGETEAFIRYRHEAHKWNRSVEKWTYTVKPNRFQARLLERIDKGGHYVRINVTGSPNETDTSDDDIDVSFLELVRLGLREADDPLIRNTILVCDSHIRRDFAGAMGWYRYPADRYGEDGRGRIWPLLTGERGHREIAAGRSGEPYIRSIRSMANGVILSEQVWDTGALEGKATGSCAPLAWAHAEYVKLVLSDSAQRIIDMPEPMRGLLAARIRPPVYIFPMMSENSSSMNSFQIVTDRMFSESDGLTVHVDGMIVPHIVKGDLVRMMIDVNSPDSVVSIMDSDGVFVYQESPLEIQVARKKRRTMKWLAVTGSFNAWNPSDTSTMMTGSENGQYTFRRRLQPGTYEYKYTVNGSWEINFGGVGGEIRQDGPNYRLEAPEESDYIFTIDPSTGGFQKVERVP